MKGLRHASPLRAAVLVAALATSLVIAACSTGNPGSTAPGASPTTVPTATDEPTPRPTPGPDDVAAAFLDFIQERNVTWVVSYTGTVIGDEIEVSLQAEVRDIGESEAMKGTVSINGKISSISTVRIHDELYKSADGGPWLPSPVDATYDFGDLFQNISALEFLRREEEGGVDCWWFSAKGAEIPTEVFQVRTDPEPAFTPTRFDLELATDGTPMAVEVEADVTFGPNQTAKATYRWEFSRVGDPLNVRPPADAWLRMPDANCGFSVAFPGEMLATQSGDGCLSFGGLRDTPDVYFTLVSVEDVTIPLDDPLTDEQATLISDWWIREFADDPTARERITLGDLPAIESTYRWTDEESGTELEGWVVVQRRDTRLYLIDGAAEAAKAETMRAVFDALLTTIEFEDGLR